MVTPTDSRHRARDLVEKILLGAPLQGEGPSRQWTARISTGMTDGLPTRQNGTSRFRPRANPGPGQHSRQAPEASGPRPTQAHSGVRHTQVGAERKATRNAPRPNEPETRQAPRQAVHGPASQRCASAHATLLRTAPRVPSWADTRASTGSNPHLRLPGVAAMRVRPAEPRGALQMQATRHHRGQLGS